MLIRNLTHYFKYTLWSILIIGISLFTPIPIYLGKFFIEKRYDTDINLNQITGGLAQGIYIRNIKLQNLSIENIKTSTILSFHKKTISFSKINIQIPKHADIRIKELKLKASLLSFSNNLSVESNSVSINGKNYNLEASKNNECVFTKLFNLDDFIELVANEKKINSIINIKDIGVLSRQANGNLKAFFEYVPKSNSLPSLSLALNSNYLKFNDHYILDLQGAVENGAGKITGNIENQGKQVSWGVELSKASANLSTLLMQIQHDRESEDFQIFIEKVNDAIQVFFDKSKENKYQGVLSPLTKMSFLFKYKDDFLEIQSHTPEKSDKISASINMHHFYGNADIALNNIEINNKLDFAKESILYSGRVSIHSKIDFNRTKPLLLKSKFSIKDFNVLTGTNSKTNIFQAKDINGDIKYDGIVASILLEDSETNKLKLDLKLKDNLTSPYGRAKIKLDATILEHFPELFSSAKGVINVELGANGKLCNVKAYSEGASFNNPIIDQDIEYFEAIGKVYLEGKYSINGKASTNNNEVVFFNINSDDKALVSKFSTESIDLTPFKENKLTSKVQGLYTLSFQDNSSSIDILADLKSAKFSLASDEDESTVEDISDDIIFIKNEKNHNPITVKKKDTKVFKISAKQPVIYVEGDGFSAKIKGNLDITQDNSGCYYANGLLVIDKGKYKNLGKIFNVKRGSILYLPNTPISNPIISIQLEQQTMSAGEEHLSIWLYGPINKLKASFSHDQHFSFNEDIINSQASLIAAQMANASGKSIASQLQNSLNLDELSLESSSNSHEPSVDNMVLSVGKQLSKKIYVKFKKDISGTETRKSSDAIALKYKLNKNFSLNVESSTQNNEVSLQFTHEDG